ncbi:MAG: hypothetical protein RLZ98_1191 [Pseudomonadota bacterium]|jgi:hypothetical protein
MQASKSRPRANNGGLGVYHFTWGGAALAAAGYLAFVAFNPEFVGRLGAASGGLLNTGTGTAFQAADHGARLEGLTRSVAEVESGLADVRRAAASHRDVTESLTNRVAALEARFDPNDVKVSSAPAREGGSPGRSDRLAIRTRSSDEAAPVDRRGPEIAIAQDTSATMTTVPKVINSVPIVTGSIPVAAPPPPSKVPAKQRVAARMTAPEPAQDDRQFGLEIGRGPTLEVLRSRWAEVSAKNAARLKGLAPHYRLVVDKDGDPLRLIAGPVVGEANAKTLCRDLAVLGTRCRYSGFTGKPL